MPFYLGSNGSESFRFWSRVLIAENGCWEWQGAVDGKGYGAFVLQRKAPGEKAKQVTSYWWAYTHCVGQVLAGNHLHHKCENTLCVNPLHLEQLTPKAHVAESLNNPCCINRLKTHCKRGHPLDANNTRINKDGSRQCKLCAYLRNKAPKHKIYMRNYMRERMRKIRHE